mgnify:CR=1 FL=1
MCYNISMKIIIKCLYCGIEKETKTTRKYIETGRNKYCSRECKSKAQLKGIYKTCPVCKKEFYVARASIKDYTTCSLICARKFPSAWRRYPALIKTCQNCGKEFRDRPSFNSKYCCVSCYRKNIGRKGGETSIEKRVKLFLISLNVFYEQEYKIGRYAIDFYIPRLNLAIECDGNYWHRNKSRDKKKNAFLKTNHIKLLRLTEDEINHGEANDKIRENILDQNLCLNLV